MNDRYEFVEYLEGLPIKAYVHTVRSFPLHWHKELEVLLAIKGSFFVEFRGELVRVSEGDIVVIGPNVIHATSQTEETNQVIALQVNSEDFSSQKMFEDFSSREIECFGNPATHPMIDVIRKSLCTITLEVFYRRLGYLYSVSAQVQVILGTLMSHFSRERDPGLQGVGGSTQERLLRILDFINEHYMEKITLQDLASREFIGTNYLSSYIKKNLGMTLSDYLSHIRLKKFHERLQTDFFSPINDLAIKCGFSSPQYAASLFQRQYDITPGKFRREVQKQNLLMQGALQALQHGSYLDQFPELDISLVTKYLDTVAAPYTGEAAEERVLTRVDCAKPAQERFYGSAIRVTTFGRAYEGLLSHVQRQLSEIQAEIGFSHVRFHGIMSDDMMLIKADSGGIRYNFFLVDQLLDFLLSIGLKPFLELTFMPTILASGDKTIFSWGANITPPASLTQWCDLVIALMRHLVSRYGANEVKTWFFEVWNEPDYVGISWTGNKQDFFRFYTETAGAIVSVLPEAKILGPSITTIGIQNKKWAKSFMNHCEAQKVPVHAFSLHLYSEQITEDDLKAGFGHAVRSTSLLQPPYPLMQRDYAGLLMDSLRRQLGKKHAELPLVVTEWNLSLSMYNPINDSPFAGTSLLSDALKHDSALNTMAHWTALDYLEEAVPMPASEFHGGFGLMTVNGIRKPTFWALWALSRLGDSVLSKTEYSILTRKGDDLVLLVYHHPMTESAYDLSYAEPYHLSQNLRQGSHEYSFELSLDASSCLLRRHHFRTDRSDGKTILADLKLSEPLTRDSIEHVKKLARPVYREESAVCDNGTLTLKSQLKKCEFELITISPIPGNSRF